METFLIEINNNKAYKLLKDLEELDIIKVIKSDIKSTDNRLSQKYKGVFGLEEAESFKMHTQQSRKE